MLDRVTAPEYGTIKDVTLMEPTVQHLDNGIPVFSIDAGTQEVMKVELVFDAGTATADRILIASTTSKLLTAGTSRKTAAEIAETVDFYGAHLQAETSHDDCSLTLFTLSKHLQKTLPVLTEVYADAIFPEDEIATHLSKSQQEMLVNQEKVSYLGAKAFAAALFGENHPYGRSASVSDYDSITRNDVIAFYQSHILNGIKHILIAGKLNKNTIELLNNAFGKASRKEHANPNIEITPQTSQTTHVEKVGAVQNSIKIGRVLFNRKHADFIGLQVLSTVLGGYFGSRLMSNIREDKGYTYGIGAGIVSLKNSGYLSISTEVGADVCKPAINEIFKEIERLRKEPISINELDLVRNYMLGSILKSVDGPFAISDKWKTYLRYDLGMSSHNSLIKQIQTITPERLRELANIYFKREDLLVVTAGKSVSV